MTTGVKPKESAQRAAERTDESMNEKFFLSRKKSSKISSMRRWKSLLKNEYKRASTELMAVRAGVSKGLLFYYFHNKRNYICFCTTTWWKS